MRLVRCCQLSMKASSTPEGSGPTTIPADNNKNGFGFTLGNPRVNLPTHIYVCKYVCMCTCIHIYLYVYMNRG